MRLAEWSPEDTLVAQIAETWLPDADCPGGLWFSEPLRASAQLWTEGGLGWAVNF